MGNLMAALFESVGMRALPSGDWDITPKELFTTEMAGAIKGAKYHKRQMGYVRKAVERALPEVIEANVPDYHTRLGINNRLHEIDNIAKGQELCMDMLLMEIEKMAGYCERAVLNRLKELGEIVQGDEVEQTEFGKYVHKRTDAKGNDVYVVAKRDEESGHYTAQTRKCKDVSFSAPTLKALGTTCIFAYKSRGSALRRARQIYGKGG